MKKQSLTLQIVCFLLHTGLLEGYVCAGVPESSILKFCQSSSSNHTEFYLDSSGFAVGDIGECACNFSSTGQVSFDIKALLESRPGNFDLVVDGNTVKTPVRSGLKFQLEVLLRKHSVETIVQCLHVTVYGVGSSPSDVHVACQTLRDMSSEPQINTEIPTTTQPGHTPASTFISSEIPTTTQPSHTPASTFTSSDIETNGSRGYQIGIIVMGGIAGIVIVVAVLIVLRRKHRRQEQPTGNTDTVPDYYNLPGGSVDQLHVTASNNTIPNEYVNTQVEIETADSNAANMNMHESLAPQDQTETDHNYHYIASAGPYLSGRMLTER